MLIEVSHHTIDDVLLRDNPVVLDVGSRNYGFAKGILAIRPKAKVVCLEPDPDVPEPDDDRITLIRKAMVGQPRESAPYCRYSTGEGNYLKINDWFTVGTGEILEVPCITFPQLCDDLGIHHWHLVKLDCEGEEFSILENWPVPPKATQISVEFHDFTSLNLHNEAYYQKLFGYLHHYKVAKHGLTPIGPGKVMGHWDSLLTMDH